LNNDNLDILFNEAKAHTELSEELVNFVVEQLVRLPRDPAIKSSV